MLAFVDADSVADAPDVTVSVTCRRHVGGSSGTEKNSVRPARLVLVATAPTGSVAIGARTHEVEPSGRALVCVRAHAVHASCPASENVLTAHLSVTLTRPGVAQYEPARHRKQTEAPGCGLYVLDAHGTALTRPAVPQKWPAVHGVVLVMLVVAQKAPIEHGVQALRPVVAPKVPAAHTAAGAVRPVVLQNEPSVQGVCVDMPMSGQNLPAWHGLQRMEPVVSAYLPAGQGPVIAMSPVPLQ